MLGAPRKVEKPFPEKPKWYLRVDPKQNIEYVVCKCMGFVVEIIVVEIIVAVIVVEIIVVEIIAVEIIVVEVIVVEIIVVEIPGSIIVGLVGASWRQPEIPGTKLNSIED